MNTTTKEQVTVTLLVDLEYETQDGREHLIQRIKNGEVGVAGCGTKEGRYSMIRIPGSVTVSSNDESTIRAWRVQYRNLKPVIVRTVSEWKASLAVIRKYNLEVEEIDVIKATRAPLFDWNSNLVPGIVYSLEHAEAGNKK